MGGEQAVRPCQAHGHKDTTRLFSHRWFRSVSMASLARWSLFFSGVGVLLVLVSMSQKHVHAYIYYKFIEVFNNME